MHSLLWRYLCGMCFKESCWSHRAYRAPIFNSYIRPNIYRRGAARAEEVEAISDAKKNPNSSCFYAFLQDQSVSFTMQRSDSCMNNFPVYCANGRTSYINTMELFQELCDVEYLWSCLCRVSCNPQWVCCFKSQQNTKSPCLTQCALYCCMSQTLLHVFALL